MDKEHLDFYQKLRKDVKHWVSKNVDKDSKWSEYILIAPDIFHLLCKLSVEKNVPASKKIKLVGAIAYFISPIDLMPEGLIGPIGYLDDIALAAYVLNDLINEIDPQIIRKHWAGEKDILDLIKTILANADKMIGGKMWQKIRKRF